MVNSIRTPRQGKTAGSREIAEAVDDQAWQEFRISLKGISTRDKLNKLQAYYEEDVSDKPGYGNKSEKQLRYVRIDNYIKALCRGGQLYSAESLQTVIASEWNPDIKS